MKGNRFLAGMVVGLLVAGLLIWAASLYRAVPWVSSQFDKRRAEVAQEADPVLAAIELLGERVSLLELAATGSGPEVVVLESQDLAAEEQADLADLYTATTEDGGAVLTALLSSGRMGAWEVQYFSGATQMMKDWVFSNPDPTWAEPPNVDWPAGNFVSAHGLEYGQELSDFCQQDTRCDFPVAARSFRSITADYSIAGVGECQEGGTGIGCAVILINVGDITTEFRDQQIDTGHTITGLYWHGDFLNEAISALASHVSYRMIGVPSGNPASPGANCSVPAGCEGVDITFVVLSGNELLLRGHTVVRP